MTHPCDGHACDHCYLCDVVGICCLTVSGSTAAVTGCCQDTAAKFRQAVVDETQSLIGLSQLIQVETALQPERSPRVPAALPPGPAADLSFQLTTTEEAKRDAAA